MKKLFIIIAVITLLSIITTSCKKSCNCYNDEDVLLDWGDSFTTREECSEASMTYLGIYCKWE